MQLSFFNYSFPNAYDTYNGVDLIVKGAIFNGIAPGTTLCVAKWIWSAYKRKKNYIYHRSDIVLSFLLFFILYIFTVIALVRVLSKSTHPLNQSLYPSIHMHIHPHISLYTHTYTGLHTNIDNTSLLDPSRPLTHCFSVWYSIQSVSFLPSELILATPLVIVIFIAFFLLQWVIIGEDEIKKDQFGETTDDSPRRTRHINAIEEGNIKKKCPGSSFSQSPNVSTKTYEFESKTAGKKVAFINNLKIFLTCVVRFHDVLKCKFIHNSSRLRPCTYTHKPHTCKEI